MDGEWIAADIIYQLGILFSRQNGGKKRREGKRGSERRER